MESLHLYILIFILLITFLNSVLIVATISRTNRLLGVFQSKPELQVGAPAPSFRARLLSGEVVSLTRYRGKKLLLAFLSTSCSACGRIVPNLEKIAFRAKENDVEFVVVIENELKETLSFRDEFQITLPIIPAPRMTNEFARDYNPGGIYPYYCLIDEQGLVQSRDPIGPNDSWQQLEAQWKMPDTTRASILRRYG